MDLSLLIIEDKDSRPSTTVQTVSNFFDLKPRKIKTNEFNFYDKEKNLIIKVLPKSIKLTLSNRDEKKYASNVSFIKEFIEDTYKNKTVSIYNYDKHPESALIYDIKNVQINYL